MACLSVSTDKSLCTAGICSVSQIDQKRGRSTRTRGMCVDTLSQDVGPHVMYRLDIVCPYVSTGKLVPGCVARPEARNEYLLMSAGLGSPVA